MSQTLELEAPLRRDPVHTRAPWAPVAGAWALLGGSVVVAVAALGWAALRALSSDPVGPYVVQQFWLSYEDGFVRRGFIGAVLRWVSGGEPPSYGLVRAVGVGLTVLALAAILALALALARRAADRTQGLLVAATVIVSPVALQHFCKDFGRGDTVGVIIFVLLALMPWRRMPVWLVSVGVAALSALAVAVTEFLLLMVVPLAVAVLWRRTGGRATWLAVAALLPATVLAAVSAVVQPSERTLDGALADARAAGAQPPPTRLADDNPVTRLGYGFWENATDYYALTDPLTVVVVTLLWAASFALTLALVWHFLGGSLRQQSWQLLAAYYASVALVLSVAGVDWRRWWALVTIAALAMILLLRPEGAGVWRWRLGVSGVALSLLGIGLLQAPLFWTDLL